MKINLLEPDPNFLNVDEVSEIVGIPKSTLYAHRRKGLFPQPFNFNVETGRVTGRTAYWDRTIIDQWMEDKYGEEGFTDEAPPQEEPAARFPQEELPETPAKQPFWKRISPATKIGVTGGILAFFASLFSKLTSS